MRRYRVKRKEEKTINDVFIVYSSLYAFSKRQKTVFFTFPLVFFFKKKSMTLFFMGLWHFLCTGFCWTDLLAESELT